MSPEALRGRRQTKPTAVTATIRTAGKNNGWRSIGIKLNGRARNAATEAIPNGTKQNVRNQK
jgi:hypothetical protein